MTQKTSRALGAAVVMLAGLILLCGTVAEAAEKKKKSKSTAEIGIPKGGNVSVKYGYHHYLENVAGSVTDTDPNFHSPAVPAEGSSSSHPTQKTTTYDGGEAHSEWDVTIDNALTDPKHILIDITKLLSESTAPKADPFSAAVSKSSIKVDGQILWSDDIEEKVTEKRKLAAKTTYIETKKELVKKRR